jgi:hypothetical protein
MKKTFYMVARIDRGIDPKTGEVAFTLGDPKGRVGRNSDATVAISQASNSSLASLVGCDATPTVAHHSKAIATAEAQRLSEKHPEAAGFAVLKAVAFVRRPRTPVITESLK